MSFGQDQALQDAYNESRRALRLKDARVGYAVAGIMVPLGVILDYMVYRPQLGELMVIRLVCTLLLAGLYIVGVQAFFRSFSKTIELAWSLIISAAIALMIYITEGVYSPYYAGLNLVILGTSLMLPLSAVEAIIICSGTIFLYCLAAYPTTNSANLNVAFNNLFFLTMTGAISCVTSHFAEKQRFVEFRLRWELDSRNKQLAELDRMKSDFYANISHELRTPLTLILAPVEDLLANDDIDKKVRGQLGYVQENTYRLLKLVNDLLDVLKLEEKKDLLEQQPVVMHSVLSNIISGMEPLAARKVIQLSYRSADDSASVLGDASALEKILINLINNALKFTEPGGSVSVDLGNESGTVVVKVKDTGVGIAADELPNIFDRFHQVDSSATRKHQGTGLGLALVKELTELQGGHVKVQSKLGVGTTMTVQFPELLTTGSDAPGNYELAQAPADDELDTLHRTASFSIAEPRSSDYQQTVSQRPRPTEFIGAKLLIVEDEPDVRNYLSEALSSMYEVDVALDGAEGLRKIQEDKPDLVVLDLMLPKMDGLSVCAEVRKNPECRQTKIMLLTARTDEQSKMTALEHGADDFLTKPFSTVEIKTRLRNLWENSGLERELKEKNTELVSTLEALQETQGQLVQSEKLNAIGRLAAGLLHEVNNPLNFAFGTFQLLEREPSLSDDSEIKEMMADIRVGLERIASIVKDLKAFAYPEKTDIEKVFLLRSVVESAVRLTAKKTYNTNVEIDVDEGLALKGSQSHIVQILVNLIENAVDAMTEAEVNGQSISIFLTDHKDNPSRVCVHVKDNGPGISAEKIGLIFDPFFTTKDVGAGMGMGLSVATTIIKNHGGQLNVESEEGIYTDFYFDLKKEETELAGKVDLSMETKRA